MCYRISELPILRRCSIARMDLAVSKLLAMELLYSQLGVILPANPFAIDMESHHNWDKTQSYECQETVSPSQTQGVVHF